jgi:hypothetical protein
MAEAVLLPPLAEKVVLVLQGDNGSDDGECSGSDDGKDKTMCIPFKTTPSGTIKQDVRTPDMVERHRHAL